MKVRTLIIALTLGMLVAAVAAGLPGRRGHGAQFWDGLAADFDQDQDGRITLEEFGDAEATFEHLDRNDDGVVSRSDFERGRGMRGPHRGRRGGLLVLADADGDGAVTSAEIDAFLAELDADADGLISADEVRETLGRDGERRGPRGDRPRRHRPFDHDGDGDVEVEDLRAAFAALDENGDGVVEGDELPAFGHDRRRPGGGSLARRADTDGDGEIASAEWQAFVAGLDADGSGEIDWEEWHAAGPGDREPRPERFRMILHVFDRDDDGVLETSDLDALFSELDADHDGVIEEDELPRYRFRRHRHG